MPASGFHYVYNLRDVATGQYHYTGVTQDLQERITLHMVSACLRAEIR